MSEAIKEAEKILKQYYGYDHFREGQIPVIKAVSWAAGVVLSPCFLFHSP